MKRSVVLRLQACFCLWIFFIFIIICALWNTWPWGTCILKVMTCRAYLHSLQWKWLRQHCQWFLVQIWIPKVKSMFIVLNGGQNTVYLGILSGYFITLNVWLASSWTHPLDSHAQNIRDLAQLAVTRRSREGFRMCKLNIYGCCCWYKGFNLTYIRVGYWWRNGHGALRFSTQKFAYCAPITIILKVLGICA